MPEATTENPSAVYAVGEEVVFQIDPEIADSPWRYTLSWEGMSPEIMTGEFSGPTTVSFTPEQPGFLRLTSQPVSGPGDTLVAAAAISPEKIEPSMPVPEDFDEFWNEQTKNSAPISETITLVRDDDEGKLYCVELEMEKGGPVFGWLRRPLGDGPFPGAVRFHGAGVYAVDPDNILDWSQRGFLTLTINSHSIPNDREEDFYEKLAEGELSDYRRRGREKRESLYFIDMFRRAVCAVDYLAHHPDRDSRTLIIDGHSQGGGQALAATALSDHSTGMLLSCPTHCDHTGFMAGRSSGWPQIVERAGGTANLSHITASRYIDGVNFAGKISVPSLVSVAFLDATCPPTGIYAMINVLKRQKKGPVTVIHEVDIHHICTPEHVAASHRWAAQQLA